MIVSSSMTGGITWFEKPKSSPVAASQSAVYFIFPQPVAKINE
jgi:hypothetical protein